MTSPRIEQVLLDDGRHRLRFVQADEAQIVLDDLAAPPRTTVLIPADYPRYCIGAIRKGSDEIYPVNASLGAAGSQMVYSRTVIAAAIDPAAGCVSIFLELSEWEERYAANCWDCLRSWVQFNEWNLLSGALIRSQFSILSDADLRDIDLFCFLWQRAGDYGFTFLPFLNLSVLRMRHGSRWLDHTDSEVSANELLRRAEADPRVRERLEVFFAKFRLSRQPGASLRAADIADLFKLAERNGASELFHELSTLFGLKITPTGMGQIRCFDSSGREVSLAEVYDLMRKDPEARRALFA